jgi:thiol-disulfide isomerase/thioredoxin
MARVVTVDLNGETVAHPYDVLQRVRVANDVVGGVPIAVLWSPGTASALDANSVAGGRDVGAATTFSRDFDGQTLTLVLDNDRIIDQQTGSEWDVLGQALSGPLEGQRLEPVVSINHFWFSWAAFRPETRVYSAEEPTSAAPSSASESAMSELVADFEIIVYQGEDVLGGEAVNLSDVLAQGKPVVLNFWAGLCPLCRAEMPELQKAHDTYGDQVLVLGVDIGPFVGLGSQDDALDLLEELNITYPAGAVLDPTVMREYEVLGTPANYFLTRNGEINERWNGLLTEDQLNNYIEALLQAPAG